MNTFINIIIFYSVILGVDPNVSLSVAQVESKTNPDAVGISHKEVGLFQIRSKYVKEFTRRELFNPYVNAFVGISAIKKAKDTCIYKIDLTYLICYNLGNSGARRIKHPSKWDYIHKVKQEMNKLEGKEVDYDQNSLQ